MAFLKTPQSYWDEFQNADGYQLMGGAPTPGQPLAESTQTRPTTATQTAPQGFDVEGYIRQRQQQLPPTPASLETIYNELRAKGIDVQRPTHAGGTQVSDDKLVLPGGQVVDMLSNVGSANSGWGFTPNGYWVDGKPSQTPGVYTPPAPENGGLPPGYAVGYGYGGGQYPLYGAQGVGLNAPFNAAFQAPDPNQIENDPSFTFQLEQGAKALQRSAAAKGTLLTGGTLKDLEGYAQGLAHTFDDKYYNRAWQQYGNAQDLFFRNNGMIAGNLGNLAQSGYNAANQIGTNTLNQSNAQGANAVANANATNTSLGDIAKQWPGIVDWWKNRTKGGGDGEFIKGGA